MLLVNAPFPGRLKFQANPSSMLNAITPFVQSCEQNNVEPGVGYLDPGEPSHEFWGSLRELLLRGHVRAVCLSSSTAAIEEAAKIVSLVQDLAPSVLLIAGGPHEDDCREKMANRIPGIDLSIGGEAEFVLDFVLRSFLNAEMESASFCAWLGEVLALAPISAGRFTVSSSWWGRPASRDFDFGAVGPEQLIETVQVTRPMTFSVFEAKQTLPLMVSRGCSYGKCTFCAEASLSGRPTVWPHFEWVRELIEQHPGAALYFQDSIFPQTKQVREELLPLLKEMQVEWGCQVYLRGLSKSFLEQLASHGCSYLYTGIETSSSGLLDAVGKVGMGAEFALERLGWIRDQGIRAGVSLMFGVFSVDGVLLENHDTVNRTVDLTDSITRSGVDVAGFYPNVLTVLPGTGLERGLHASGIELDFYSIPRAEAFSELEDGSVGYNFLTVPEIVAEGCKDSLAEHIAAAALQVQRQAASVW